MTPEGRRRIAAVFAREVQNRLSDIRFAPALGGFECDEVRTSYGQFFVKFGDDLLALLLADALPQVTEKKEDTDTRVGRAALDALEFAQGAILDAIGLEDGLDGAAGAAVIRLIRDALTANGRTLTPLPDETTEALYESMTERLYRAAQLSAVLPRSAAQEEEQNENEEKNHAR